MTAIAIFGITGRMGQTLVRALGEASAAGNLNPVRLVGAVASPQSTRLGLDAAIDGAATGVLVTALPQAALEGADVAIDFSLPHCVAHNAGVCAAAGVPLLVGATGFDAATRAALEVSASTIPVLIAPNTSTGVNLVAHLVRLAARAFVGAEVEISEAHHRMKRDAPSGTALSLGAAVAAARGQDFSQVAVFERRGSDTARAPGEIGFSVVRAGDIVGEHTVLFAADGERVEITHRATDRITFARGALGAARWLAGRRPGLYSMEDVLGLDKS